MGETFAVEVRIEAPAAAVWAVIGDPEAVPRWYPTYVRSTVAGDVRTLERADGVVLEERLLERDDAGMSYAYTVTGGLPLREHRASFTVVPDGDGARVVWRTHAVHRDPGVDMEARLADRQREALAGLKALVEGSAQG